ncbi:hypothetical protein [Promicromonospora sp. NPDC023805]|uniref:hypothetical protein n=1 Tax=Promicromonospora sp. NPDC023805 TaxID=3154696 RepID=UPI0033CD2D35
MSARRSPIESGARSLAASALATSRKRAATVHDAFMEAVKSLETRTTWAVQRDDIPQARRLARAVELLDESLTRLIAREQRATARELARAGLTSGVRVRVVRHGYSAQAAPIGTVVTLDGGIRHRYLWSHADDGQKYLVHSRDIELVDEGTAVAA